MKEILWLYWEKDDEGGTAKIEETRKFMDAVK